MKTAVFVYGTLKRGGRNHRLLAGQEFRGEATTLPDYRLYDNGSYPCLVEDLINGVAVQGEVWRVDEGTLARLDECEGVPQLFMRRQIRLADVAAPVVAYFYQGDVSTLTDCGDCWPAGWRRPAWPALIV